MDKIIASFFYDDCVSVNIADSSSFARMIEESMRLAKQNPCQRYKAPSRKRLSGISLTEHTSQLSSDSYSWQKFGATGCEWSLDDCCLFLQRIAKTFKGSISDNILEEIIESFRKNHIIGASLIAFGDKEWEQL